jgi:AraC-like DNA-binding protein
MQIVNPDRARERAPYAPAPAAMVLYNRSNFGMPWHRHRALQFTIAVRGRATFLVEDRAYRQQPRSALWVFPEQDHAIVEQTPDFMMWVAYFPTALVRRVCTSADTRDLVTEAPRREPTRLLDASAARTLDAFVRGAYEIHDEARYRAALVYLLLSAWELYSSAPPLHATGNMHPSVERAAQVLGKETEATPLGALARRVGLSASRLSRVFHEQMGVSIPEFRNQRRIDRFLAVYGDGRRFGLTEAALEANFGSYSQFQRVFERVMQMSPAEYRRKVSGR